MASLIGLAGAGARNLLPMLGNLARGSIKYIPAALEFGAQAAPMVGQGLDFLTNKFSKGKRNYNFASIGSELKGAFDTRRDMQMQSRSQTFGRGGRQNFPLFEDEMDSNEINNGDSGNFRLDRRQYGRGSEEFFGSRNNNNFGRDDFDEVEESFDNPYGRQLNQGFKRPFNVYAERSFGNGYGRNSTIISGNEMTRGSSGGFEGSRKRSRYNQFEDDEEEDYQAAPKVRMYEDRSFQRRQPVNTSSRYGSDRVANLNYEDLDWTDLI